MWRIKYYLPLILLVTAVSFYFNKYVVPIEHPDQIKYDQPIDSRVRTVYDFLNTKFEDMPDFKNFKIYVSNIENRKKLLNRLDEMRINYRPFSFGYEKGFNTIWWLDNYLFYERTTYFTFNYIGFFGSLILFALFPILIFEVLRSIYFLFSKGRFSESYVSLFAKNIQLKYRLAKIEKKKSNEALKQKLVERDFLNKK